MGKICMRIFAKFAHIDTVSKNKLNNIITLICKYFKDVRKKYVKQYYYNRPSMMKFIELMNNHNSKEQFRFMLFLKIVFKLYAETL